MPAVALEAADLVAIMALLVVIGLLLAVKHLLQPIAGALINWSLDLVVWSGHPLAWLGHDIDNWIVAGISDAIDALGTVVQELWSGLTWAFGQMLDAIIDVALKARGAVVFAVDSVVKPWVLGVLKPVEAEVHAIGADVSSLGGSVAANAGRGEAYATAVGAHLLADATGFATHEIGLARAALETDIGQVSSYVHSAAATAEALPGTITADFPHLWSELQKYVRPQNLADLLSAGLLSGMLLRVIAQEAGLDSSECQAKHKQICGVNPAQWTKLLEGLALLGFTFDLRELVAFADGLAKDVKPIIEAAK